MIKRIEPWPAMELERGFGVFIFKIVIRKKISRKVIFNIYISYFEINNDTMLNKRKLIF